MDNEEEIKKQEPEENFQDVTFVDSTEDGDELPTKDIVKKLREDLKKARAEKEEYLTGWQRAKADYINLQKEMDQISKSVSIHAKERIIENLLPALDSFDMAFANKDVWENVDKNWRTGIEYIYQQFMTSLSNSGVEKIDKVNVPFDPNLHQSIESVLTDDQSKDHIIEKVIQAGYKIGDPANTGQVRIIRPARVTIFEFKTS
ncbi:MAG TPA: nucleotide exchange factor GrpE [Candidatus Paceibacterota bacterium]|jgi:molecular chaperone GrpE|nr:nucleotide exchange factor GrpE [Candidatus Paceibacterota bacterium]